MLPYGIEEYAECSNGPVNLTFYNIPVTVRKILNVSHPLRCYNLSLC